MNNPTFLISKPLCLGHYGFLQGKEEIVWYLSLSEECTYAEHLSLWHCQIKEATILVNNVNTNKDFLMS